jgi:hypothetical protein
MHYCIKVIGMPKNRNESIFNAFFIGYVSFDGNYIVSRLAGFFVKRKNAPPLRAEFFGCRAAHTAARTGYKYRFHFSSSVL